MKALEKAAKDRGEAAQPAPTPGATAPAAAAAPATTASAAATSRTATSAATSAASKMELALEPLPADTPELERTPAPAPAAKSASGSKKIGDQARAATVLQASSSAPESTATKRRVKPVILIGGLAGIAIIAFGIYVYLQITNPGLFIRQAPLTAKPPLAQTQPPAPKPPITTETLVAPATPAAAAASPTVAAPSAASAPPSTVAEAPAASRPAAAPAARPETPRDSIKVSAGSAEPQLDSRLTNAYAALQSGKTDEARQLYAEILRSDGKNIQGLLGSAAVAMQQNNTDEASRLYFRVLDLDPRNPYAQAGIVAMMGRADPAAAEAKLKQLIAREPIASLHFTLGNLYGDQSRWAEAQQSYFQAHQLEPGNPDYAYNLAVGLEHIGQTRLASGFYRRAVELAQARGRAGFNLNQAQDRIRQLAALPE